MMQRRSFYFRLLALAVFVMAAGGSQAIMSPNPAPASGTDAGPSLLELPGAPPPAATTTPVTPSSLPAVQAPPPLSVTAPASSPAISASTPLSPPPAPSAMNPMTPHDVPKMPPPVATAQPPATAPRAAASTTSMSQASQAAAEVYTKNADVLFVPIHVEADASLMFKKNDMNIVTEALGVYDKNGRAKKVDPASNKDDLSSLLSSLKNQNGAPDAAVAATPPPLPNLYLGSIVYYSPSSWSVWINGKKLTNSKNQPGGEFHVTKLSREEIELIWKPLSLLDTPATWQRLTDNGAHPLSRITVNEGSGTITLLLHTNQTFLPRTLAIREGLIKSSGVAGGMAGMDQPNMIPPPPMSPALSPHAF